MKDTIRLRLEKMTDRFEEVGRLLAAPETVRRFTAISGTCRWNTRARSRWRSGSGPSGASRPTSPPPAEMSSDPDQGMRALGEEEVTRVQERMAAEETALAGLLIPKDERDDKNLFLEVRAGTGGDEAAIFAGDLFRMYARYAEQQGWSVEILSENPGEHGGYREIITPRRGARRVLAASSSNRARIACSACRRRKRRGASTRRRARSPSCRRPTKSTSVEINPADLRSRHVSVRPAPGGAAREQDGLGDPHHALAERHRRRVPGRALPAQEPLTRDGAAEGPPAATQRAGEADHRAGADPPQAAGGQRRSLRAHPHLQLPAGPASPITASTSRSTSSNT